MKLFFFAAALLFVTVSGAKAQDQATVVATCGAAHLTPGTQAFRQVDTNGVTCSAGGGSAVVSSVWSASDAAANAMTLSNGGLTVTQPNAVWASIRGSTAHSSGKFYVEFANGATSTQVYIILGMADAGFIASNYLSSSPVSLGGYFGGASSSGSAGITFNYDLPGLGANANDVWGIAIDMTAGKFWVAQNNVWFGSGNPVTGANPMATIASPALGASFFPAISLNSQIGSTGSWTLQSTAASQKYAAPSGFTAWDSAGTGCSQATAYLARATGETAHAADLTTLICGLVSDGVWSKLDALYVLAQQTQADAQLNLVSGSYSLTGSGRIANQPAPLTLTFTPYVGFSGFSIGLDTGFNPTVGTPHYIQFNASLGVWSYSVIDEGKAQIAYDTTSYIVNKFGGLFYPRVNDSVTALAVATSITKGLSAVERSDASNMYPYQNGVSVGPLASTPSALSSVDFFVGGNTASGGATTQTLSAAFIGASLGSAGQLALYTRLRAYMTSIGVP